MNHIQRAYWTSERLQLVALTRHKEDNLIYFCCNKLVFWVSQLPCNIILEGIKWKVYWPSCWVPVSVVLFGLGPVQEPRQSYVSLLFGTSSRPRFVVWNVATIKSYPHNTTRTMTRPQLLVCVVIPIAVMNLLQGTNTVPVLFSFFDAICVHKEYKSNRLLHLNSQFRLKNYQKIWTKKVKKIKKIFLCKIIVRKMAKPLLLGGDHYWWGREAYTVIWFNIIYTHLNMIINVFVFFIHCCCYWDLVYAAQ